MKSMYQAQVTSQGGRNGHVKSSDGLIDFDVTMPKEMGGTGRATNPEQLFAAGYSACFENAVLHIARTQKMNIGKSSVTATVNIGANPNGQGFALTVKLEVSLPEIAKAEAEALIEKAHQICPYSNATRGNIPVDLVLAAHA